MKLKAQKELTEELSALYVSEELEDESIYISEDLELDRLTLEKLISDLQARIIWNKIDMIGLY